MDDKSNSVANAKDEKAKEEAKSELESAQNADKSSLPVSKDGEKGGKDNSNEDSTPSSNVSGDNKRPREATEEDSNEESARKKGKKDENAAANASSGPQKPSRGTRGSLSEKSDKGGKGGKRTDKRSSPPSSATNSPKKPASRDHSDEDESETKGKTASSAGSESSGNNEPKVPPLKIVLSGQNGSNGTGSVVEDKKSPSGKDDSKEVEKPALTSKESSLAVSGGAAASAAAETENSNTNQSAGSDGMEECDSKGNQHGTRLTRSRANQGTPGPSDQGSDSPGESTLNQCENANLEPPSTKDMSSAGVGSGSGSNMASQNSQSSSNNMNYADYHVKKRKLRSQVEESNANGGQAPSASVSTGGESKGKSSANVNAVNNEPLNDIEKYLNIRKQVEQRRKNLFPVQPKPPEGFKDYLMNRKTYLLQGNAHVRSIPKIQPPHSLDGPLRELFKQQEEERYKLRIKHVVEKEKLVLAVEQEILRVHGRAARALANQSLPYSVCTILRDEEIYNVINPQQEEKNRDVRSRYNGRLFISWLEDVDDKWEKIKEQMVLRHHNEAESLNAVQKMDWEWKVNEITGGTGGEGVPLMDDLHIPMVNVSDDFDMTIS